MKRIENFDELLDKCNNDNDYFKTLPRAMKEILFYYNTAVENNYNEIKVTNSLSCYESEFIEIIIENKCNFVTTVKSTGILELTYEALKQGMKVEPIEITESEFGDTYIYKGLRFIV